ncbi:N-acetylmuramoyl-L-alanine amidase [Paenibacillus pasadenensis]|uniref:N-acetylmuramoyl-L-alanine amidase n=1 Tax=Paenibacillus pasadenensis TaxID=217090 RepID=UPI00203C816A|nr:N-acetylmuramoyl-L-alanine amidase [Paenibacillus pasadenensis]MCM3745790.1 N-acetylmuramoyl-L-alanine amidase [Paenibacillus pasadenensis]
MAIAKTPIMGQPLIQPDTMTKFVQTVSPAFNPEIARQFYQVGSRYGVRGDIALCQSIHETNWFRFGGLVKPEQNNYAGIGATGPGNPGTTFATIAEGVTAQIQHLYAYASKAPLPNGEKLVDPRFTLVTRGIAPNWEDLGGRWAVPGYDRSKFVSLQAAMDAGETYGQKIVKLYQSLAASAPKPNNPPVNLPIVVLDAGHGGTDPGAQGYSIVEKESTLDLVMRTASLLRSRYKVDVRLTRSTDVFVPLPQRASMANGWGAAYFVSFHHNASGGEGFESFVYSGTRSAASGQKQNMVHDSIMKLLGPLGVANRGKKEANFAVLRETTMPSVLLENLFVDNAFDSVLLKNPTVRQDLAEAIAEGVAAAMALTPNNPAGYPDGTPDYKVQAIEWLYDQGFLTDPVWKQQPNAPLPLWAEALILQRLYAMLKS